MIKKQMFHVSLMGSMGTSAALINRPLKFYKFSTTKEYLFGDSKILQTEKSNCHIMKKVGG